MHFSIPPVKREISENYISLCDLEEFSSEATLDENPIHKIGMRKSHVNGFPLTYFSIFLSVFFKRGCLHFFISLYFFSFFFVGNSFFPSTTVTTIFHVAGDRLVSDSTGPFISDLVDDSLRTGRCRSQVGPKDPD